MEQFLEAMMESGLDLDDSLRYYGNLLVDTEVDQAYRDYADARTAIKRVLKRIARENDLIDIEDLLD